MKVGIWSDVVCPFCHIGKRRFEDALNRFEFRDQVEVVWKSFLLNPDQITRTDISLKEHLAESKGWSLEYTSQMQDYLVKMAADVGLHYDFDKAVAANSTDAHRLIQLAQKRGKGDEAEEALFRAYFTDGKNIADHAFLAELGECLGFEKSEVLEMLNTDAFWGEVQKDIYEARQIGVKGVPYFVFNDRYAVSGAQPADTFLGALNRAFSEMAQ
jgi:predicted DsbA family dithiol-disulfide isomerase